MSIVASPYRAPWWLRNAHLQSVLSSSGLRVLRGARVLAATGAVHAEHVLDAGDGVRLHGIHSHLPGRAPRGMALLLHGWEGSAESGYMRLTAATLLEAGFDVFRLNFRDHGPSHHLNPAVFHSCRLDEVLGAAAEVARRWPTRPLVAAGYSLGGNFALRLALQAPRAGLPLARVAAVCPALDPEHTTTAMESGIGLYQRYFAHKWTRSLRQKRALFPDLHGWDDALLHPSRGIRALTELLLLGLDDIADIGAYFDGYNIAGDRLAGLQLPADLLTSADDPVIPVADFERLRLPAGATVEIAAHGGHCGFLHDASMRGYAEGWVAGKLAQALVDGA